MAPELLFSTKFGLEKGVPSKEADVYALGMAVYQVLTGKWPFFPMREGEVTHAVISGERPSKPENAEGIGMTEAVWDLLRECWKEDRMKRPNISDILKRFCAIADEGRTTDSAIEATTGLRLDTIGHHSESAFVHCEWGDPSFERPHHLLQKTHGGYFSIQASGDLQEVCHHHV